MYIFRYVCFAIVFHIHVDNKQKKSKSAAGEMAEKQRVR